MYIFSTIKKIQENKMEQFYQMNQLEIGFLREALFPMSRGPRNYG